MKLARLFALVAALALVGAAAPDPLRDPAAGAWPSDGRDYTAQRYSPLTQIDAGNVKQLGLAWYDDLGTYRGVEATPIYADGVLTHTTPDSYSTFNQNSHPLIIGWSEEGDADRAPLRGAMDNLRLYTRALSPTEIVALYDGHR